MEITVHSSKLVKPAYGDDGRAGDVIPLSVFDRVNYNEYIFYVYAFHPPAPPSVALEAGLARALAAYPEWAGRLGDGSAIVLCDSGARFVEATADSELSSGAVALLATGNKALMSLYPSCDGAEELLLVQATRFPCGSLVVGFTMHHKVADGPAMWNFMVAWGQATRGVAINPVPVHDRTSLFARRGPPQVRFEHRGVELKPRDEKPGSCGGDGIVHAGDEVVVHKVHFSREWIMELKSLVSEGDPRSYTTLQCLAAHLWRCVTKARGLDGRQATRIRIAVNGRTRMRRPRVPEGYTGSVVLWAWPTTTARQLLDRPLRYAVELISEEVARMDDAYFRSFIDFAASGAVEEEKLVPTADAAEVRLGTNVDLDSLLAIPFPKLDLGCGAPFFFRPGYSPAPVDGAIYVVKSFVGDGSVDAYVPLCSRAMDNFKKCCYSLPVPVPVAARL
ncbi:hypothetical protein ZWY2020_011643 [Hordeum vulgare]|nr:hypothetical protein ZWY2020_011643 [Hordeum vulgare]